MGHSVDDHIKGHCRHCQLRHLEQSPVAKDSVIIMMMVVTTTVMMMVMMMMIMIGTIAWTGTSLREYDSIA
jgi:hypothetical protein